MSQSPQPFRLLDLPAELRVMVYERVTPTTHQHVLAGPGPNGDPSYSVLVRQGLPTALLQTCRQIEHEAKSSFDKKYDEILKEPVRFVVDKYAAIPLVSSHSPLIACFGIQPKAPVQTGSIAVQLPTEIQDEPLELPLAPSIADACALHPSGTSDIEVHHETVSSFVARAAKVVARTRLVPNSADHAFDIEFRLLEEIGGWKFSHVDEWLFGVAHVAIAGDFAILVTGKNTMYGSPYVYSPMSQSANSAWRTWKMAFAAKEIWMTGRHKIRLVDLPYWQ
jgi:hypothetical protein